MFGRRRDWSGRRQGYRCRGEAAASHEGQHQNWGVCEGHCYRHSPCWIPLDRHSVVVFLVSIPIHRAMLADQSGHERLLLVSPWERAVSNTPLFGFQSIGDHCRVHMHKCCVAFREFRRGGFVYLANHHDGDKHAFFQNWVAAT